MPLNKQNIKDKNVVGEYVKRTPKWALVSAATVASCTVFGVSLTAVAVLATAGLCIAGREKKTR